MSSVRRTNNISQNQPINMGYPNSAPDANHAPASGNFSKLRQSRKYDVITVIPDKTAASADLAAHFPNTAKKVNEYQGQEMKPESFFKRLKNAVGSIGKDKSHLEVDESDPVHWRRAHLAAKEKSRSKANTERAAAFIESRKEKLEQQDKAWKAKALKGAHKDEIAAEKAHLKQTYDAANARREKRLTDIKSKLAEKDKERKARAKKAIANKRKLSSSK